MTACPSSYLKRVGLAPVRPELWQGFGKCLCVDQQGRNSDRTERGVDADEVLQVFYAEDAQQASVRTPLPESDPLLLFDTEDSEPEDPARLASPVVIQDSAEVWDLPLTHALPPPMVGAACGRRSDARSPVVLLLAAIAAVGVSFVTGFALYSANHASPAASRPDRAEVTPLSEVSDTVGADATSIIKPPGGAPREVETPRATDAARPEVAVVAPNSSLDRLSGDWLLATEVESSSLSRFKGLRLGYRVQLQQVGDSITGSGHKISENGQRLATRAQTGIALHGTLNGNRLDLTFTEQGARRPTSGRFVLVRDTDDVMRGRFSTNAAQSRGVVEARRS